MDGAQSGEDDVFGLEVEHPVRGSGRSGLRVEGACEFRMWPEDICKQRITETTK